MDQTTSVRPQSLKIGKGSSLFYSEPQWLSLYIYKAWRRERIFCTSLD